MVRIAASLVVVLCLTMPQKPVLQGQGHNGDWKVNAPGVRHRITPRDLPKPYVSRSVDRGPKAAPRPEGAWPKAPAGFKVEAFATGLREPRAMTTAPNGDVFVAESHAHTVKVFRDANGDGKPEKAVIFASNLQLPFGIAFYPPGPRPQFAYVANTDAVVRFPYGNGDLRARGAPQHIADLPGGGRLRGGGHWTRDIVFSPDGRKMFLSVGSLTNVMDKGPEVEKERADILEFNPDGTGRKVYASGIRNAVGIAIHPQTHDLWASVNERDELGDDLPPEYITRIRPGGFYGWPWYYIGPNQDPRHKGAHPELQERVIVPDVLIQTHSASLQMCFYTGDQFPKEYANEIFAAEHGSWSRSKRTGYKVIRVFLKNGVPTGEYEDFLTGFVIDEQHVWGRPVGVTVAKDGAQLVSDDGSGTIWRVSYKLR